MDKEVLHASSIASLTVVRQSEMGAFLDAGTGNTSDDILLHKIQQTEPVNIGDTVKVFLYRDPKGRLTASMRVPKMREGQIARVKVINTSKDGAFVDVGAERGIFMPFAQMRGRLKVGEVIWAKLYTDKSGRLAASMDVDDEMRRVSKPAEDVKVGAEIHGTVYNCTDKGIFALTDERYIAFADHSEIIERPKVGDEVIGRVTFVREDGRINFSMRLVKEKALSVDAARILAMLEMRHGRIPYGDSTAPEIIKDKFNISKAAFKRALGQLIKEGKIEQRDGWTFLK